ncbi:hypothetical protein [Pseudoalteromonas sp. T1lg76]|uniref:hypothetical protein n=1 Tax=Pseudoalteromonas sp. T1lg76 TaxID=2077103 RepID=UPI000CF65B96|nr:hypothetical protein [Pseudoalteromonas sp. T1lg76]
MRLTNLLFLLLTLFLAPLFCSQALAAGSAQQAKDEAAIKALFASYMNKYNGYIQGKSLTHVEQLYMPQVMLMSSANPPVAMPAKDFSKQVVGFLDSLKSKGVASVNWQQVNVRLIDKNIAIATNVAVRYRDNGEVFNKVGATYFLYKTDENWRIASFAVHEHTGVQTL